MSGDTSICFYKFPPLVSKSLIINFTIPDVSLLLKEKYDALEKLLNTFCIHFVYSSRKNVCD